MIFDIYLNLFFKKESFAEMIGSLISITLMFLVWEFINKLFGFASYNHVRMFGYVLLFKIVLWIVKSLME